MRTYSGRHLEDFSHDYIVSLMYKLITSAKDADDFAIGFDHDRNRRQYELARNEYVKENIM